MNIQHQNGNVLFFILVAIALLGLLTAALNRSSSTSNDTGEYEKTQIIANEILSYAKSIENAVQNLLARGCSENEISFENDVITTYASINPNAPIDKSCHVFDVAGTGLKYFKFNEDWLDSSYSAAHPTYGYYHFNAHHCVLGIGTNDATCTDRDIDLLLNISFLKKDICMAINRELDLSVLNDFAVKENASHASPVYNGIMAPGSNVQIGNDEAELIGKPSACTQDTAGFSNNAYIFYHVLHAR